MKTFRKILTALTVIFFLGQLAGCSPKKGNEETGDKLQGHVELVVKFKEGDEKEFRDVPIYEGTTVLDVLKKKTEVVAKDGFVSSINGVSDDADSKRYWLYEINGKMASKGVAEQEVKDGDVITFQLENF